MERYMALALAVSLAFSGEAAIVYQGRLARNGEAIMVQEFPNGASKQLTFRVYGEQDAVWSTNMTVAVATNGAFTAILDDPGLTAMVTNGLARQIGLSIGDAKEIWPRRALLPLAAVQRAEVGARLVPKASVGTLTERKKLTCRNLRVDGDIKIVGSAMTSRTDRVSYELPEIGDNETLRLKCGKGIHVFGPMQVLPLNNGGRASGGGAELAEAPADGVATVICNETLEERDYENKRLMPSPCFSVVQFCRKGDKICVPSNWKFDCTTDTFAPDPQRKYYESCSFKVQFRPFLTDGPSTKGSH